MRLRAIAEASILSVGLVACLAAALLWTAAFDWPAIRASLADPLLWAAARISLQIGVVAGALLVLSTCVVAGIAIYFDLAVPLSVKIAALATALTPDLVHALVWRALLQPGSGSSWLQALAANPSLQPALLGLVLAVKWAGLVGIGAAATFPENRRALRSCLLLGRVGPASAFLRSCLPHAARWSGLAMLTGILVGLRQHELSEQLLGGGSGFAAEGLSQWISKIALSFLDPARAALELLAVLVAILLGVAVLTMPRLVRAR